MSYPSTALPQCIQIIFHPKEILCEPLTSFQPSGNYSCYNIPCRDGKKGVETIAQTSTALGSSRYFQSEHLWCCWRTSPNSSPLKIGHPKRKLVFQPSIFRCELSVSGRVYLCDNLWPICWAKTWTAQLLQGVLNAAGSSTPISPLRCHAVVLHSAVPCLSDVFWATTGNYFWDLFGTTAFEIYIYIYYIYN